MKADWLIIIVGCIILGCASPSNKGTEMSDNTENLNYLALGDSYTIGESVPENMRWPVQLVSKLNERGHKFLNPRIIATTGWTTDELQKAIDTAQIGQSYELVSLLIGVNNQYRGYPFSQYEAEFKNLLNQAINFAGKRKERVFVVSIPDYGVTPFGQEKDPEKITRELNQYNEFARTTCLEQNIHFINITDISREALNDTTLVASDRLHPSGSMYQAWVERIYPQIVELLENNLE